MFDNGSGCLCEDCKVKYINPMGLVIPPLPGNYEYLDVSNSRTFPEESNGKYDIVFNRGLFVEILTTNALKNMSKLLKENGYLVLVTTGTPFEIEQLTTQFSEAGLTPIHEANFPQTGTYVGIWQKRT